MKIYCTWYVRCCFSSRISTSQKWYLPVVQRCFHYSTQPRFWTLWRRMRCPALQNHFQLKPNMSSQSWLPGVRTEMRMMTKKIRTRRNQNQGVRSRVQPRKPKGNRNVSRRTLMISSRNGTTVLSEISSSRLCDHKGHPMLKLLNVGIVVWKRQSFWLLLVSRNFERDGSWRRGVRQILGGNALQTMLQPTELEPLATWCLAGEASTRRDRKWIEQGNMLLHDIFSHALKSKMNWNNGDMPLRDNFFHMLWDRTWIKRGCTATLCINVCSKWTGHTIYRGTPGLISLSIPHHGGQRDVVYACAPGAYTCLPYDPLGGEYAPSCRFLIATSTGVSV